MQRGLMGFITKVFGEKEDFMQAYPPVEDDHKRKGDLFEEDGLWVSTPQPKTHNPATGYNPPIQFQEKT